MASDKQRSTGRIETSGSVLRHLMYGHIVSSDFFARNWLVMFVGTFLILAYISGKYDCQTKMERVQRLSHELEVVKAEQMRERSHYMGRIRESAMQELVDTMHLNLQIQENPPYKLAVKK